MPNYVMNALLVKGLLNIVVLSNGTLLTLTQSHYFVMGLTSIIDSGGNDVTGKLPDNFEDPFYTRLSGLSPVRIELLSDNRYTLK